MEALQRIKENLESSQNLGIFVSIARRLLSVNSSKQIQDLCLEYLTAASSVAFNWISGLRERAQQSTNDGERTEYLSKGAEVALICVDSYNVDI